MNKFLSGFKYAFNGLKYAFNTQINFKVHTFTIIIVVVLGLAFRLDIQEWLWLVAAIGIVLITELINTSIEVLVDLISPEFNIKAGIIKDISAGAVLIAAICACAIGILVFIPKIIAYAT
jgi:undecaprenol kinase/diacylglycerol kinase (ATP)